ncbi:MAG: fibronectin type III domain-containing protein [Ignavibacteria bacterium]|nr:fibronectin type III domain-containing protein [Ignavibacteria bacterium]
MTGSQTLTIKYDTSGNQIWSQIYAPSYGGNQGGTGLSADNQGNAYVIGWANESNPSLRDLYCLKYDLIGNLSWSTVYNTPGGNTFDEVKDIFVDVYGNVYLAGQIAVSGNFDINILKYHQVPFPPTLISPFHNSLSQPTTLNLIWRKTSGTSYRVQVATDAGFSNLIVNDSTVTDTTKSVSGLNSNTTYYWRVNAKNAVGTSGYSSAWQFTTMPPVSASPNPISPPNNSANQPLSLTMVWSKPQFAATYRVQLATDAGFSNLIVNDSTITDTTKSVSGLNNNTTYYWRVNAKNAAGTSGYSSVWQFTTIPPVPASPNPLLPPDNSVNQPLSLNLVWSKPQFAVTYRLQVSTDAGFSNIIVNDSTLTDTTKNISALSNLTGYWWRVNAKNIAGTSGFSTAFKFTTIIAAPTAPVLFSPLNNQTGLLLSLNLVWLKRPTAQTYRVQLASDSLFTSIIVNDSTLTDSIKSVAGLQPLTNYWWRVNAKNIGGTSSYSTAWKFRTLGSPYQVELLSPPDSAVNQPVNITFRWAIANDQTDHAPFVKNTFFGAESIQKYWFELNLDTLGASVVIDSNLVDSFKTVNSLVNQTRYYWRVKAKNEIGWGGFSRWFRFNTIIQNPTVPLQFSPQIMQLIFR